MSRWERERAPLLEVRRAASAGLVKEPWRNKSPWYDRGGLQDAMAERELRYAPRVEDLRKFYIRCGLITPASWQKS